MWKGFVTALVLFAGIAPPAASAWSPSGPIRLIIAYRAGGGADTQGRLLAEELETRRGWTILPQNVTGKGGANMARALKAAPADGLSIGMAVTAAFSYLPVADPKTGYRVQDFTFITTTAPSQMGVVARADRGWKTLDDLVAAARAGQTLSFAAMSPRLQDGAWYIADHFGITFNVVPVKGGKGSLNAVMAGDVDVGWVAGIQARGVQSGDLVNLASGESTRLALSPDAPTLAEMGVPFDFGAKFVVVAPAGLPGAVRDALAGAIAEVVNDPASKTHAFIRKAFGPPLLVSGDALDALIAREVADNEAMLRKLGH